jgi:phosphate transport system ATP-binding protein
MTEIADPRTQPLESPLAGLEARRVSAWFGKRKVLERVSLDMPPGTVSALIGPSGCGKSTFLRILNRMHEMIPGAELAGEVLLSGQDIYHPSQRPQHVRSRIGMVFQKPNPFPTMSIYDNVLSGLKLSGIKVRDKDSLVESCLRRASLWAEVRDRLTTPGGALSGGQQQRLCIARSLAVSPDVLLMDEPCSALDRGDLLAGHDRHRHAQHAAGPAGLAVLCLLPRRRGRAGRHRRVGPHPAHLR